MSHTPGPWRYHEDGVEPGYRVIFGPFGSGRWKRSPGMPLEIVRAVKINNAEVDANWQLITAAPDMITALREILSVEHHDCIFDDCASLSAPCPFGLGRAIISRVVGKVGGK